MAFHVHCVWIAHYNSSYVWSVVCGTRCSRPYWWMSFESPRCPWVCIMAIGFHGAFRSIILVCVPWVLRVHAKYIIIILYTESGLITGHGWWRVKRQSLWCRLLKAPKISLKISGLHFGTSPEMSYCSWNRSTWRRLLHAPRINGEEIIDKIASKCTQYSVFTNSIRW